MLALHKEHMTRRTILLDLSSKQPVSPQSGHQPGSDSQGRPLRSDAPLVGSRDRMVAFFRYSSMRYGHDLASSVTIQIGYAVAA